MIPPNVFLILVPTSLGEQKEAELTKEESPGLWVTRDWDFNKALCGIYDGRRNKHLSFMRRHTVNESASPQVEMLQMKYRATCSVEAIYEKVFKMIRLQPLYKSTVCGTVLCTTSTEVSSMYKRKYNHGVG